MAKPKKVQAQYYHSYREVAKILGISAESVRQSERTALRKIGLALQAIDYLEPHEIHKEIK